MIPMRTAEQAQGRWMSILPRLGISASFLKNTHGPCPVCGGKDRFRFDNREGRGTFFCNGCGAGDGIDLARLFLGCDKREALRRIDQVIGAGAMPQEPARREPTDEDKIGWAKALYASGQRVTAGDPVDLYMHSRGLGEVPAAYPVTMRLARECRYSPTLSLPAMLMPIQSVKGDLVGVHRTFLNEGGGRADVRNAKKVLGVMPEGSAIRFSPPQGVLGIAEGIETAMSASAMYGLPVWAAVSSGGLERWVPPAECSEVAIFADHDDSFEGHRAAYSLAKRLRLHDLSVSVHIPDQVGDWNDVYQLRRRG